MHTQYLKSSWRLGLRIGTLGIVLATCIYGCAFQADGTGDGGGDLLVLSMREISDGELTLIAPEDATIECDTTRNDGALARWLSSATAESTCGAVTLVNDFTGLSDDCGSTGSATVTWIAEDECGNEATHTAAFVIVDTTPPEIGGPEDVTVPCEGTSTADALQRWLDGASAGDGCGEATLSADPIRLAENCGEIGTTRVTWTATDDCGNVSTHTATFTVEGTTPSLVLTIPDDVVVECNGEGNEGEFDRWVGLAEAEGGCGGISLTHEITRTTDQCGGTFTSQVTWTATDACGNTVTRSALFTVADSIAPAVNGPDDLQLVCGDPDNRSNIDRWLASASAEDDCGDVAIVDDFERLSDGCGQSGSETVTWTAADECGNTSIHVATVAVVDSIAPAITVPEDRLDFCEGDTDLGDLRVWLASAVASDECGEATVQHDFSRESVSEACDALVTWTATDECGNSVSDTAVAAIQDVEPPGIALEGSSEMILECNVDSYVEPGAAVVDACDTGLTQADIGGDIVDTSEPGLYIVSYHATDLCGNTGTPVTRDVEVVDTLPPSVVEGIAVELWPPNHDYWNLSLADCVRDLCEINLDINAVGQILSICSDEPENANGDGNTLDDIVILSNSEFMLRAERQGGSNGRVYGITFEISDSAGNGTTDTCLIGVPHDQSGALPSDDGSGAGYTVLP